MLKKYITTTLLLIISLFVFGQNNYIELYYKKILDAEKSLIIGDFNKSSLFYQEAFKSVSYGFCYDYGNAAYVAYLNDDYNMAQRFLDSAVIRGMRLRHSHKKFFENRKSWLHYKNIKYDSLRNVLLKRRNNNALRLLDSVYFYDQYYRSGLNGKKFFLDSMIYYDSLNAIIIKENLLNGTIIESKIGFNIKPGIIIVHKLLEDTLLMYELYNKGYIEKRDYYYSIVRKTLQLNEKSKYLPVGEYTEKQLLDINKKRESDGIISIEGLKKLRKYEKKSKKLFFTY